MKYLHRLRRGTRYVDENGATLLNADGTPVRDDWQTYTNQANHQDPMDGELVIEYEFNPATGKKIPRMKIGDGVSTFAELEYISVDSFILPTQATITITPNDWLYVDCDGKMIDANGNAIGVDGAIAEEGYYEVDDDGKIIDDEGKIVPNRYVQFVNVVNATVTPNSKVDIQPSPADLAVFHEKDVTFTAINAGGKVRVCVVGQKPTNSYTFNVTVTEVV